MRFILKHLKSCQNASDYEIKVNNYLKNMRHILNQLPIRISNFSYSYFMDIRKFNITATFAKCWGNRSYQLLEDGIKLCI